MKTLLTDLFTSLFNWFRLANDGTSLQRNHIWCIVNNNFVYIYIAGATYHNNRTSGHGIKICIVTKNHPDCTNGFKAIKSHYVWLAWSRYGNFGKGGLWRKWDMFCNNLKLRFWYV
jgi:hypothetical protein